MIKKLSILFILLCFPVTANTDGWFLGNIGSGCPALGDNIVLGQQADLSSETSVGMWWASKFTASASSSCVGRIKIMLTSGSDAESGVTIGVAIFADSGSGYPNGGSVLGSVSTGGFEISGGNEVIDVDLSGVADTISSGTPYWIGVCATYSNNVKVEYQSSAGAGLRYMAGETNPASPPADWSGSSNVAAGQMSMAATY